MAIIHLEEAKQMRAQGRRLGRAGMSLRVKKIIDEFDGSYKGAMKLAGRMKAITQAAKCDLYWDEQVKKGFNDELRDIKRFDPEHEAGCDCDRCDN